MEATLAGIIAAATPLVYAVVGETITERAGVVNLSLEGSMRLAALVGFAAAFVTGNAIVGFLAAMGVGAMMALIVAACSIELRLNQIAVGFVLTLLAIEITFFFGDSYVGVVGERVPRWPIPILSDIPFVGRVLFRHNLLVYGSYIVVAIAYVYLFRTRRGLAVMGVGERPEGAFARGLNVNRIRYAHSMIGGALVGVAGAAFTLDFKLGWNEIATTNNYGWIALAIVIFGGWHPVRAAAGAYLFGVLEAVALELQPVFPNLVQILQLLPFPLMIFALVLVYLQKVRDLSDRHPGLRRLLSAEPPSALGTAFHRE